VARQKFNNDGRAKHRYFSISLEWKAALQAAAAINPG
jgi:hypothetical protein